MSEMPGVRVLYSSFKAPPATGFQGYCFVDAESPRVS